MLKVFNWFKSFYLILIWHGWYLRKLKRRKLNSLVFITQSYFPVPKNVRLNSTYCFGMKIPNKRELQEIAFNHLSVIDFQDLNFFKECAAKSYSFFWLLILHLHQVILHVLEKPFAKSIKTNHDNWW